MTTFERIKKLAEKQGKSLQKIAEDNDFSPNLIYRWQKSDPKAKDIAKVASYFHVSTDYLLGNTDDPTPVNRTNHDIDLADDSNIFTYEGRPIPEEDLKIIKRLLNSNNDN